MLRTVLKVRRDLPFKKKKKTRMDVSRHERDGRGPPPSEGPCLRADIDNKIPECRIISACVTQAANLYTLLATVEYTGRIEGVGYNDAD